MRGLRPVLAAVLLLVPALAVDAQPDPRQTRLQAIRQEIGRLETELARLNRQEGGVLGEFERLSAELSLGRSRLRETTLLSEEIGDRVGRHERALEILGRAQEERRNYLSFRLREMYKGGPMQSVRRLFGESDLEGYWGGLRYAAFLSARDRAILTQYRQDEKRVAGERAALEGERERLDASRREIEAANRRLASGRRRQSRLLEEIRDDSQRRESALTELRTAAGDLESLIGGLEPAEESQTLDMSKFRGLLDWPAEGKVRSAFGTVIHPRFKTKVPHPGIDIEAPQGDPIRSVFDGEVVFSGWMRGYGLTTIVDHGQGLHSVYAHASVTWVEPGEAIRRGQRLGLVGETGSFSGPSLYFELRLNGRAVDPEKWLRRR